MRDSDQRLNRFDPTANAYQAGHALAHLLDAVDEEETHHRVEATERETHYRGDEIVVVERQVVIEEIHTKKRKWF